MKEKLKNKKVIYTIIGIAAVILVTIGITYAYWLITKNQTGENLITSACLDISLTNEQNDITLTNQFPLSDEDGASLTPYEFTVTNNCNTSVDYQIALETFDGTDTISSGAIKVMIDSDTPVILSSSEKLETRISNATNSYFLKYGTLTSKDTEGSSTSHSLRLWIDENAPISEMKKTLTSKISVTIGQGITHQIIKKGTLAYDILTRYGGETNIEEIDATWTEGEYEAATEVQTYNTAKIYWGTSYDWDATTGKYKLAGNIVAATVAECRDTEDLCGEYTLLSTTESSKFTHIYKVTSFTGTSTETNIPFLYILAQKKSAINSYSTNAVTTGDGLYKAEDDLGDSYYFKGNITDNYVQLGVWKETTSKYMAIGPGDQYDSLEECESAWSSMGLKCVKFGGEKGKPMYWRIVRINGDGTLRLIYDGTSLVENGVSHNAIINIAGQTFAYSTSSEIKKVVDTWYTTNLKSDFEEYIADGIFCNDIDISYYQHPGYPIISSEQPSDFNFGSYSYYFEPYIRLRINKAPKLKCSNKADRYTVNDTSNGNGLLTNPIGLITADEAHMASDGSYLYSNYSGYEWTMTPGHNESGIWLTYALGSSKLIELYADTSVMYPYGVRPVINLKAEVLFTGTGTIDDPYIITTN